MCHTVFEEDAVFKCQICRKIFFTKIGLKTHSTYEHNNVTVTYKEQEINNKVMTKNKLAALKRDTGDETRTIQSKLDFLKNVNKSEQKSLKCDISDLLFDKKNWLTSEINKKQRALKNVKCQTCEKKFSRAVFLKEHRKAVHEKLKPHQRLVCEKA